MSGGALLARWANGQLPPTRPPGRSKDGSLLDLECPKKPKDMQASNACTDAGAATHAAH